MQLDILDAPDVANGHDEKAPGAFKTISEAAAILDVPQHVLRFWESHFAQIKPLKMRGGRRYYRPEDMETLSTVKHLLYQQGYTIKGAKKHFSARNKQPGAETVEEVTEKPVLSDGQQQQLSDLCDELKTLREMLKSYL